MPKSVFCRGSCIWKRLAWLVFNLALCLLWRRFQRIITFAWKAGHGGTGRYWKGGGGEKGDRCFDLFCLPLSHAKAIKKWVYVSVTRTILTWLSLWLFTAGVRESPLHWKPAFLLTPISLLHQRGLTAYKWQPHSQSSLRHFTYSEYTLKMISVPWLVMFRLYTIQTSSPLPGC